MAIILIVTLNHILTLIVSGYLIYHILTSYRHHTKATKLRGPRTSLKSYVMGLHRYINMSPDPGEVYERWAEEYGSVYRIPDSMGGSTVVITDPKAVAYFYTKETYGYVQPTVVRMAVEIMVRVRN
jgi:hypothetical protein